eukprot:6474452-Amphidinium_carterae.2
MKQISKKVLLKGRVSSMLNLFGNAAKRLRGKKFVHARRAKLFRSEIAEYCTERLDVTIDRSLLLEVFFSVA